MWLCDAQVEFLPSLIVWNQFTAHNSRQNMRSGDHGSACWFLLAITLAIEVQA
jgi:hypothetical protein